MATMGEQPYSGQGTIGGDGTMQEPEVTRPNGERSVGSLFGELIGETSALVRAELTLARREMQDNMHGMQRGVASMAVGAGVLTAGLLALVACAILALAHALPDWLSALIVGAIVSAIGAIMLAAGKRKAVGEGMKPTRTLNTLTEMKSMARQETDRAARKWR